MRQYLAPRYTSPKEEFWIRQIFQKESRYPKLRRTQGAGEFLSQFLSDSHIGQKVY